MVGWPFRIRPELTSGFYQQGDSPVSVLESSRRALAPGFGDLQIQPGLTPRPARQQPRFAKKRKLFPVDSYKIRPRDGYAGRFQA